MGTGLNVKPPSSAVCVISDQLEAADFNVTVAPAIGRCPGSWTIPRTLPNIVARASGADTPSATASKKNKTKARIVPPFQLDSLNQWNEARPAVVRKVRQGTPKKEMLLGACSGGRQDPARRVRHARRGTWVQSGRSVHSQADDDRSEPCNRARARQGRDDTTSAPLARLNAGSERGSTSDYMPS